MPTTTREVALLAGLSEQGARNYIRRYAEFLSPQARGEKGQCLFDDHDVQVFCSIAAMRKEGISPAEIMERMRRGDLYIEPQHAPHNTTQDAPQATQTALEAPQALMLVRMDLQRQIDSLRVSPRQQLWRYGVAFYLGMVTMGVAFWLTWLLNNWWYR